MSLADRDLFEMWRFLLATACCIYALVVTGRSLWRWVEYFSGSDPRRSFLRRLTIVQLLRLRIGRFSRELARIGLLLVILVALLYGHT